MRDFPVHTWTLFLICAYRTEKLCFPQGTPSTKKSGVDNLAKNAESKRGQLRKRRQPLISLEREIFQKTLDHVKNPRKLERREEGMDHSVTTLLASKQYAQV